MARNRGKQSFIEKAVNSPGSLFSWIIDRIFGSTPKNENGKAKLENGKPIEYNGLLGILLDVVKAIGRGISAFIENHEQAIAIAFWASLVVAGGLTLAFHLAPAFLATVANFSLYGYSIASVVGAEPLLQMGLAAGLAVVATSAVTYIIATFVNLFTAIKECIYPPVDPEAKNTSDPDAGEDFSPSSHNRMITGLSDRKKPGAPAPATPPPQPPVQGKSPISGSSATTSSQAVKSTPETSMGV